MENFMKFEALAHIFETEVFIGDEKIKPKAAGGDGIRCLHWINHCNKINTLFESLSAFSEFLLFISYT